MSPEANLLADFAEAWLKAETRMGAVTFTGSPQRFRRDELEAAIVLVRASAPSVVEPAKDNNRCAACNRLLRHVPDNRCPGCEHYVCVACVFSKGHSRGNSHWVKEKTK